MINLIEIPQRSDMKIEYKIDNAILIVTLGNIQENFDFRGLEEGIAGEIIVEQLPFNPILKAERTGNTINIEVIRFYSFEEKELFENGYNQVEN